MGRPRKTVAQFEAEAKRIGKCLIHHRSWAARKCYILRHGPLPTHVYVLHKCDNHNCILDAHHFTGSQKDNVMDAITKGRMLSPAWRKAVSKRVRQQHKAGKFGRQTWRQA